MFASFFVGTIVLNFDVLMTIVNYRLTLPNPRRVHLHPNPSCTDDTRDFVLKVNKYPNSVVLSAKAYQYLTLTSQLPPLDITSAHLTQPNQTPHQERSKDDARQPDDYQDHPFPREDRGAANLLPVALCRPSHRSSVGLGRLYRGMPMYLLSVSRFRDSTLYVIMFSSQDLCTCPLLG